MKNKIEISEFTNPSGATVFRMEATVQTRLLEGKETAPADEWSRVRKNFPTKEEAEGAREILQAKIDGREVLNRLPTRLDTAQLHEAESCIHQLQHSKVMDGKATLTFAVEYFLRNYREPVKPSTLKEAFDKFMDEKKVNEEARPDTLRNLNQRIGAFVDFIGGSKQVSEIVTQNINDFINRTNGHTRGGTTKRNDKLALNGFFNWCWKDKEYCVENPVARAVKTRKQSSETHILPIGDVRKLLSAAMFLRHQSHETH